MTTKPEETIAELRRISYMNKNTNPMNDIIERLH